MRSTPLAGLTALALVGVLTACGSGSTSTSPGTTTGTTAAPASPGTPAAFPVTVTSCGRTLTFDKAPERVVVDGEVYAIPLFQLGVGDRVVKLANHLSGKIRDNFDVDPTTAATLRALPVLTTKTSGGVSDEALLAERPDLVIQAYDGADFGAAGGKEAVDRLADKGVKVFTLAPDCGGNLDDSLADITRLGQIFGMPDKAAKLVATAKDRIAAARAKAQAATKGRVPKVFFLDAIADDGTVYGNTGAFNIELIRAAGGEPVPATGDPNDIYTLSKEAVAAARPDIAATYSQDDPPGPRLEKLWKLQPDAPATKAKRSVVLTYPDGGGTVEYVELLADAIAAWGAAG